MTGMLVIVHLNRGDQVLLLLPTSPKKLQAAWHGPYTVISKKGPVDYEIEIPERRKKRQVFHINMLRTWRKARNGGSCVW